MIQVKVAEGGYYENTLIIKDIEFEVLPGKLIRLIGSNGLGKSTTIQAIMGTLTHNIGVGVLSLTMLI